MIFPLSSVARVAQTINRERRPGLDVTTVRRRGLLEAHITLRALRQERPAAAVHRLVAALEETGATPVHLEVFGALGAHAGATDALEQMLGRIGWPVTWMEETSCPPALIGGMHVLAVAGAEVRPIEQHGRVLGCTFQDDWARHCVLGGVTAETLSASVQAQTAQLHERVFDLLQEAGMEMSHAVRAWFAVANLPDACGASHQARNEFGRLHRLCAGLAPASTCIGARNPLGAAIMAGVWAIRPLSECLTAQAATNPHHDPAREEDGGAAQAVEITSPDHRRLFVSAGSGPDCASRPGGGCRKQFDQAMRSVESLLAAHDFSFLDVTRATVHFKHASDTPVFTGWCVEHDALFLPVLVVQSDVGGKHQLFQIELDALAASDRRSTAGGHLHATKQGTLVLIRRKTRICKRGFRRPAGRFPGSHRS